VRLAAAALALLLAACNRADADAGASARKAAPPARAKAASPREQAARLDSGFARIERETGGRMGVYAIHLGDGRRLEWRPRERFPMASTYKVPISMIAAGRAHTQGLTLDEPVPVLPSDLRPAPSPIADSVGSAGGTTTLGALIRSALMYSDNTASDVLLRWVGGPRAVTARFGVAGMRVDRPEGQIQLDWNGVTQPPPPDQWSLDLFRRLRDAVPDAEKQAAHARFYADPRDTATPEGMATVLRGLEGSLGMPAGSRRFLLDAMAASVPGPNRLKGMLPAGTRVEHKTGTIGQETNDVGLITLPDGARVAIAVFVRAPGGTGPGEQAIARAAKLVYDLFTQPAPKR
jgi:beta-lactamase class A